MGFKNALAFMGFYGEDAKAEADRKMSAALGVEQFEKLNQQFEGKTQEEVSQMLDSMGFSKDQKDFMSQKGFPPYGGAEGAGSATKDIGNSLSGSNVVSFGNSFSKTSKEARMAEADARWPTEGDVTVKVGEEGSATVNIGKEKAASGSGEAGGANLLIGGIGGVVSKWAGNLKMQLQELSNLFKALGSAPPEDVKGKCDPSVPGNLCVDTKLESLPCRSYRGCQGQAFYDCVSAGKSGCSELLKEQGGAPCNKPSIAAIKLCSPTATDCPAWPEDAFYNPANYNSFMANIAC
jgi:hypothetical protein